MSTTYQIIADKCIYVCDKREWKFEDTMESVQTLLQGKSKSSTFDALHKGIHRGIRQRWEIRDDLVKPFGDRRHNLTFVCSINLNQDLLTYSDENGHIQLSLARLREPRSDLIQRSEFTPLEIESPPQLDITVFPPPYQEPSTHIPERRLAFSSRVLSDFADLWRHILRSSYAESTFRRLAKAVVSIATNDFQFDEVFTKLRSDYRRSYVTVLDLPSWEPYEHRILSIGGTIVILDQDLQTALKIAKEDAKESNKVMKPGDRTEQRTYLLLSIRHMLVCYVSSTGSFSYTAPRILIDGVTPPSPSSINLLLQALCPTRLLPQTPIHRLPLEIQDRILEYVSEGSVEAARLGCVLGLGSIFGWMRPINRSRRCGPLEILTTPSHRVDSTPVESKICFGGEFSGLSYR